jgi:hypothetical protein
LRSIAIRIRRALFGIARREARFERRGFATTALDRRTRLELIGSTFIDGYNAWLSGQLEGALSAIEPDLQGFAVEGAAMAGALLDQLSPWHRGRWAQLLRDRPEHIYMIHVGAGWATARFGGSLVADGWGFHQTYFRPAQWASGRRRIPPGWGYVSRAVDQGIGRALWFVAGADPSRVARHVERFVPERHADLWSGVGLAATYAGGCGPGELPQLVALAGACRAHLAQGAAFAVTARQLAGNATPYTDAAAIAISGRSAGELARLATLLRPAPPHDADGGSYEIWRVGLARALAARRAA